MSPLFRRDRRTTTTGEQNQYRDTHSARRSRPDPNREAWARLYKLSERQYALFTWAQAGDIGLSREAVRSRTERGAVERWGNHVLAFAGAPRSFRQRCMAASLDCGPGAAISGLSAAALWQLPGFQRGAIEVVVPPPRRPTSSLAVVRQSSLLGDSVVLLHGIPVITPTALVCDLLGKIHPLAVERVLEITWAERLLTGPGFHVFAERWLGCRYPHADLLRALLASHPRDWVAPASGLERRFRHLVMERGFEEPERQISVGDDVGWIGRVDVRAPRTPVLGEINSDRYHVAPLDAASDAERYLNLVRAGFVVAVFRENEVWYRPRLVVDRWAEAHDWHRDRRTGRLFLPPGN